MPQKGITAVEAVAQAMAAASSGLGSHPNAGAAIWPTLDSATQARYRVMAKHGIEAYWAWVAGRRGL